MVVGANHKTRQVWNGKPDECHRTAICRGNGREPSSNHQEPTAHRTHVYAQVARVCFAQQQRIEGFDQQNGTHQPYHNRTCEHGQLRQRHAAKVSHAPHGKRLYAFLGGKKVEKGDGRRGQITNHHTDNEQHHTAFHPLGEHENDACHGHGTHKCGQQDSPCPTYAEQSRGHTAAQQQHNESHAQCGPAVDAKDRRACQRILKRRLQQQTGGGECGPAQQRSEGLRQTRLEDDELPTGFAHILPGQNGQHILRRYRNATYQQVEHQQKADAKR